MTAKMLRGLREEGKAEKAEKRGHTERIQIGLPGMGRYARTQGETARRRGLIRRMAENSVERAEKSRQRGKKAEENRQRGEGREDGGFNGERAE